MTCIIFGGCLCLRDGYSQILLYFGGVKLDQFQRTSVSTFCCFWPQLPTLISRYARKNKKSNLEIQFNWFKRGEHMFTFTDWWLKSSFFDYGFFLKILYHWYLFSGNVGDQKLLPVHLLQLRTHISKFKWQLI